MNNIDTKNSLIIFSDGSSLGNPGPGAYGALIILDKLDEIIELGGMKPMTTNNEMELTAIISALGYSINNSMPVHIFTDSQYVINGITKWVYGWVKNGWQTKEKEDVKNKQLWQSLYDLVEMRGANTITWHHVRGHVGVPGNERVDTIARELAEGKNVSLYRGKLSTYPLANILTIHMSYEDQQKKAKGEAYSYLSLVDGVLEKHNTWKDCEARVKGKKAKFKKALSPSHEEEIQKEWGI